MLGAFFGICAVFRFNPAASGRARARDDSVAALGVAMEFLFMRPALSPQAHRDQVLRTFGFTFVFFDIVQAVWGRVIVAVPGAEIMQATSPRGRSVLDIRLFMIGNRICDGRCLLFFFFFSALTDRSRLGAMVRAGVEMPPWRRARAISPLSVHRHLQAPEWRFAAARRSRGRSGALAISPGWTRKFSSRPHRDRDHGGMGSMTGASWIAC